MIRNSIRKYNAFPLINWVLISEMQVKYVVDINVTRDILKLVMLRKEVIRDVSDIRQAK